MSYYILYFIRENNNNPVELKAMKSESLKTAPWVKGAPIKILIHGYTGHKNFSPNTEIRPGLFHKNAHYTLYFL